MNALLKYLSPGSWLSLWLALAPGMWQRRCCSSPGPMPRRRPGGSPLLPPWKPGVPYQEGQKKRPPGNSTGEDRVSPAFSQPASERSHRSEPRQEQQNNLANISKWRGNTMVPLLRHLNFGVVSYVQIITQICFTDMCAWVSHNNHKKWALIASSIYRMLFYFAKGPRLGLCVGEDNSVFCPTHMSSASDLRTGHHL